MEPSPASPAINFPTIGTPHHGMEEDQMINPQAQEAQQRQAAEGKGIQNFYSFGGMTPQNLLGSGQTPLSLLSNSPALGSSIHQQFSGSAMPNKAPVYAPVPSPGGLPPPSPMPATPMSVHQPQSMEPGIVPQVFDSFFGLVEQQ